MTTTYPMNVGECSRWLQVAYENRKSVLKKWFQQSLITVTFDRGEYQGCTETYTAQCTEGSIVTEMSCPGKAAQVTEHCLAGQCLGGGNETALTRTIERGQVYDVHVEASPPWPELRTGTVSVKVIDPQEGEDMTFFVDAAPEAGVIWTVSLLVMVSLAL